MFKFILLYTRLKATERIISLESKTRYLISSRPATIGNNVWIGGNTVIYLGVHIGDGATVGASSVETKSLPDNVLAYGNPYVVI